MSAIDAKTILDSVNTVSDQVVGLQGRVEDLAGEVKDAARHGGADALRDVMQDRAAVEAFWSAAFGALASSAPVRVEMASPAMMTIDALAGRFDVASMVGKNAIFIPELRVSHQTNQAAALDLLNSISGGDPQKVDDKFKKIESFVRMTGKFVITPNEESSLTDPSAAMLRRLVVLRRRIWLK